MNNIINNIRKFVKENRTKNIKVLKAFRDTFVLNDEYYGAFEDYIKSIDAMRYCTFKYLPIESVGILERNNSLSYIEFIYDPDAKEPITTHRVDFEPNAK